MARVAHRDTGTAPAGAGWIREAKLDEDGGASAVLTDAGWARLADRGKEGFIADLEARGYRPGGARPERWRFVRRLRAALEDAPALFPSWSVLERSPSRWHGETMVSEDLVVLQGHFPGEPIVPGVAQLCWAEAVARRAFPGHAATGEVARLKFVKIIVPDTRLRLALESRDGANVTFRFASDAGLHSSGTLVRQPA